VLAPVDCSLPKEIAAGVTPAPTLTGTTQGREPNAANLKFLFNLSLSKGGGNPGQAPHLRESLV
jgi:hypothetical protein